MSKILPPAPPKPFRYTPPKQAVTWHEDLHWYHVFMPQRLAILIGSAAFSCLPSNGTRLGVCGMIGFVLGVAGDRLTGAAWSKAIATGGLLCAFLMGCCCVAWAVETYRKRKGGTGFVRRAVILLALCFAAAVAIVLFGAVASGW